jgi:hypothetical protein
LQIASLFQGWRYQDVLLVLAVAVVTVVLWRVPVIGWLFYPFHIFGTFVHELSHGMAAILTGGEFDRFVVRFDQSGTAWSRGGIGWIITSAGYVGSALFGGVLLVISARDISASQVLMVMGVALGLLCLVFVRNLFGIVAGLVLAGLLVAAGSRLPALWANWLLLFLSVQMIMNALNSVLNLVWLSARMGDVRTDAQIMQDMTHIPAPIWAVFWALLSLGVLVVSLAIAYRRTSGPLFPTS